MSYRTVNELDNFDFKDAYIDEMGLKAGIFNFYLENVKIFSTNSCNRDIRDMRTNDLVLKLYDASIIKFIKEGYKTYNADGVLISNQPDTIISVSDYNEVMKTLFGAVIYSIVHNENIYSICMDTEENTFELQIQADKNIEEWERFLSPEGMI